MRPRSVTTRSTTPRCSSLTSASTKAARATSSAHSSSPASLSRETFRANFSTLGVKDSKQITSDQKALDLADAIKELITLDRFNVIVLTPEKYNELYVKFRNLNSLLAWGHASVIENLLTRWPNCPRALSDKFAHESLIQRALKEHGKKIILQQRTKAESDIAVAAASILARAAFLTRLKYLGERVGLTLPKGASAQVKAAAREIVKKSGPEVLKSVCKFHFKTYAEVVNGDLHS